MIDEIVEMILKESRAREGDYLISKTYRVQVEIEERLKEIRDNLRDEERRKKDHDNTH